MCDKDIKDNLISPFKKNENSETKLLKTHYETTRKNNGKQIKPSRNKNLIRSSKIEGWGRAEAVKGGSMP